MRNAECRIWPESIYTYICIKYIYHIIEGLRQGQEKPVFPIESHPSYSVFSSTKQSTTRRRHSTIHHTLLSSNKSRSNLKFRRRKFFFLSFCTRLSRLHMYGFELWYIRYGNWAWDHKDREPFFYARVRLGSKCK
jgi:hypothetical protein